MGIKFYCPNGHKLHVKAYLAGKRGICPHCGLRVQIPEDSALTPSGTQAAVRQPASTLSTSSTSAPAIRLAERVVVSGNGLVRIQGAPPHANVLLPSRPKTRPAIDEAPDAVWYVRPPSGGQYGPARGELMHRWLDEGRVGFDSLVWREGWPDWREAGPVFPELRSSNEPAAPVLPDADPELDLALESPQATTTPGTRRPATSLVRRRQTHSRTVIYVLLLAIASLVLIGVLVKLLAT